MIARARLIPLAFAAALLCLPSAGPVCLDAQEPAGSNPAFATSTPTPPKESNSYDACYGALTEGEFRRVGDRNLPILGSPYHVRDIASPDNLRSFLRNLWQRQDFRGFTGACTAMIGVHDGRLHRLAPAR